MHDAYSDLGEISLEDYQMMQDVLCHVSEGETSAKTLAPAAADAGIFQGYFPEVCLPQLSELPLPLMLPLSDYPGENDPPWQTPKSIPPQHTKIASKMKLKKSNSFRLDPWQIRGGSTST